MIQIDMPMPKSCMECPMCHDHIWCHAPIPLEWGESDVSQHMTDRPEWCPLKEQEPVETEMEGGGSSWWYVCGECHGAIDRADQYCRHCGRKIQFG